MTHNYITDFEAHLRGWICLAEKHMEEFMSGFDDSPYRLSSSLSTLNHVVSRDEGLLTYVDIALRDRLAAIEIKTALLQASGYDLSEELPF